MLRLCRLLVTLGLRQLNVLRLCLLRQLLFHHLQLLLLLQIWLGQYLLLSCLLGSIQLDQLLHYLLGDWHVLTGIVLDHRLSVVCILILADLEPFPRRLSIWPQAWKWQHMPVWPDLGWGQPPRRHSNLQQGRMSVFKAFWQVGGSPHFSGGKEGLECTWPAIWAAGCGGRSAGPTTPCLSKLRHLSFKSTCEGNFSSQHLQQFQRFWTRLFAGDQVPVSGSETGRRPAQECASICPCPAP